MSDNDWNDLFQQAVVPTIEEPAKLSTSSSRKTTNIPVSDSGIIGSNNINNGASASKIDVTNKKKRKRKLLKGITNQLDHKSADNLYLQMLESRMMENSTYKSTCDWPFWIDSEVPHPRKTSCTSVPFHPSRIGLSNDNLISSPSILFLQIFLAVRDIRYSCHTYLHNTPKSSIIDSAIQRARDILDNLNHLKSHRNLLSSEEATLLEVKCKTLNDSVKKWRRLSTSASKSPSDSFMHYTYTTFEHTVQIIIECDSVYYRLYYLQISNQLPLPISITKQTASIMQHGKDKHQQHLCIPHPNIYFGTEYLSWDIKLGLIATKKFIEHMRSKLNAIKQNSSFESMLEQFGLENIGKEGIHDDSSKHDDSNIKHHYDHPLYTLRKARMMETILIFWYSNWWNMNDTLSQTIQIMQKNNPHQYQKNSLASKSFDYKLHETPAPSLLAKWRDSCRDFPCNLYAYATLTPTSLSKIINILKQKNKHVIEMGAGTGYVAKLLQQAGIYVRAYDSTPTKCIHNHKGKGKKRKKQIDNLRMNNEYHGQTPPFVQVQMCNVKNHNHREYYSNSMHDSIHFGNTTSALLLCYPPPGSDMAKDALREFIQVGGDMFIHIGEMRGLTGSKKFQDILTNPSFQFNKTYSSPCASWGTDAAEITLWERSLRIKREPFRLNDNTEIGNDKYDQSCASTASILLPCCHCSKQEARKRCRLLRSLNYCSEVCFQAHTKERNIMLEFHMISIGDDQGNSNSFLEFSNPMHFLTLSNLKQELE